jgi:hypothetical protein
VLPATSTANRFPDAKESAALASETVKKFRELDYVGVD